jgi:carbon storage regulator
MLILNRRPGESLYLGENIRVTVLGVQGKHIRLGLEVPGSVTVYREEVYRRVEAENKCSLESTTQDVMQAATLWNEPRN